jgi:hypothetical protein
MPDWAARARLGDLSGAAAAFETAEGFLTASDPEAEPDWIYWFTASDLHGIVATPTCSLTSRGPLSTVLSKPSMEPARNLLVIGHCGLATRQPPRFSTETWTKANTPPTVLLNS